MKRLETDVNFKNRELASATMHLVERGKVLSTIKEELMRRRRQRRHRAYRWISKGAGHTQPAQRKTTITGSSSYRISTRCTAITWAYLKNRFPSLTPPDLKLCAYLRMKLSSKEISQLMNISVRGVEIARYPACGRNCNWRRMKTCRTS